MKLYIIKTMKSDAKFEEKLIYCFKNDKNLVNLTRALESFKNLQSYRSLLWKVYHVWPKKIQRRHDNEGVMQNLKKNWLMVWKMTWGIRQIFTRAFDFHKILTLMGSCNPKYKMCELKVYREVMCHNNEIWSKIWRRIDLLF